MRKVLIFKKGLFERLIDEGFKNLTEEEIHALLSSLTEIKIKNFCFKNLLDSGIDFKESLLISGAYEIGKRNPTLP